MPRNAVAPGRNVNPDTKGPHCALQGSPVFMAADGQDGVARWGFPQLDESRPEIPSEALSDSHSAFVASNHCERQTAWQRSYEVVKGKLS